MDKQHDDLQGIEEATEAEFYLESLRKIQENSCFFKKFLATDLIPFETRIPEWSTVGKTTLIHEDTPKGTTLSNKTDSGFIYRVEDTNCTKNILDVGIPRTIFQMDKKDLRRSDYQ